MKTAGRILAGVISILLFTILIFLVTTKFELLNKSFLFNSFEKHNVYTRLPTLFADFIANDPSFSKEEKIGFTEFVKNIPPQAIKPLIEDNLTQVLDFLNGQSKDIVISFSLSGVGFENASGIRWSLSQTPDKNLQERIKALNGISSALTAAGIIILAILAGLFFLSGRQILLSGGISIIAISLISKYFLISISKELLSGKEIAQKLLGLLSSSLFSDITNTWLIMGTILILFWLALHIRNKTPLI